MTSLTTVITLFLLIYLASWVANDSIGDEDVNHIHQNVNDFEKYSNGINSESSSQDTIVSTFNKNSPDGFVTPEHLAFQNLVSGSKSKSEISISNGTQKSSQCIQNWPIYYNQSLFSIINQLQISHTDGEWYEYQAQETNFQASNIKETVNIDSAFGDNFPVKVPNNETSYEHYVSYYDAKFSDILYGIHKLEIIRWLLGKELVLPILFGLGFVIKCYQGPLKSLKKDDGILGDFVVSMSMDSIFANRMLSKRMSNFLWRHVQACLYDHVQDVEMSDTTRYMIDNLGIFGGVLLKRILYYFICDRSMIDILSRIGSYLSQETSSNPKVIQDPAIKTVPRIKNTPSILDQAKNVFKEYISEVPEKILKPFFATITALFVRHVLIQIGFSYKATGERTGWFISLIEKGISPHVPAVFYALFNRRVVENCFIFVTGFLWKRKIHRIASFIIFIVFVLNRYIVEMVKVYVPLKMKKGKLPKELSFIGRFICVVIIIYISVYFVYQLISGYYFHALKEHWCLYSLCMIMILISHFVGLLNIVITSIVITIWKFSIGDFYNIFNIMTRSWYKIFIEHNHKVPLAIEVLGESSVYLLLQSASTVKKSMISDKIALTDCLSYGKKCHLDESRVFESDSPYELCNSSNFECLINENSSHCWYSYTRFGPQSMKFAPVPKRPVCVPRDQFINLEEEYFTVLFDRNKDKRWFDISVADILFRLIRRVPLFHNFFKAQLVVPIIHFVIHLYQDMIKRDMTISIILTKIFYRFTEKYPITTVFIGYLLQHLVIQSILYYDTESCSTNLLTFRDFPSFELAGRLFSTLIPIDELLINMISDKVVDNLFGSVPQGVFMLIFWTIAYYSIRRGIRYALYQIYPSSQLWRFSIMFLLITFMFSERMKHLFMKFPSHFINTLFGSQLVKFIMILLVTLSYSFTAINIEWNKIVSSTSKSIWNFFSMDIKYFATVTLITERSRFILPFFDRIYFPFPGVFDGLTLLLIELFNIATLGPIYHHYA